MPTATPNPDLDRTQLAAVPKCLRPLIHQTTRKERLNQVRQLIEQHPDQDRRQMAHTICRELKVSIPTAYQYIREIVRSLYMSNPIDPARP